MPIQTQISILKIVRNKFLTILLLIFGISAFILMIYDFQNYPPLPEGTPGWEYKNNYKGSLTYHLTLLLVGFGMGVFMILPLQKRGFLVLKLIGLISFLGLVILAWTNVIHQGGVASVFALWSLFLFVWGIFAMPWRRFFRK